MVGQFSDGGDWGEAEGNGFYTDAASAPSADSAGASQQRRWRKMCWSRFRLLTT
ncbi:MAG: hypothetical protein ACLR23_05590 [Clostridia bacterium]